MSAPLVSNSAHERPALPLLASSFLLGLGCLFTYNALLNCIPFFISELGPSMGALTAPALTWSTVLVQLFMLSAGGATPPRSRIAGALVAQAAVLAATPFAPRWGLAATLLLLASSGIATSVLESSIFGALAGSETHHLSAAVAVGQAVAGLLASFLEIALRIAAPGAPETAAMGYCIAGAALVCACAAALAMLPTLASGGGRGLAPLALVDDEGSKTAAIKDDTAAVGQARLLHADTLGGARPAHNDARIKARPIAPAVTSDSSTSDPCACSGLECAPAPFDAELQHCPAAASWEDAWRAEGGAHHAGALSAAPQGTVAAALAYTADTLRVAFIVRVPAGVLFAVFVVTFLAFPGLVASIPYHESLGPLPAAEDGGWYFTLLLLGFGVADVAARALSTCHAPLSDAAMLAYAATRAALVPAIAAAARGSLSDGAALTAVLALAATGGHLASLTLAHGARRAALRDREHAGFVLVAALHAGIVVGANVALVWG